MEVLMVVVLSVDTGAAGREISAMGKASHRGHRGHGGGNGGLDGGVLSVDTGAAGREISANGESIAQRPQRSRRGEWRS
jgi:hypothetical protein